MQNVALIIEYDGSQFYGFQKQKDKRTIQEVLEGSISKFVNHEVSLSASGRTDTGVHALYQVVSFYTSASRNISSWIKGINTRLPTSIRVKSAALVPKDFNARFSCISRTYFYYLLIDEFNPTFLNKKIAWYYKELDILKIEQAMNFLVGEKDFSAFRASGCSAHTPIRTILDVNLTQRDNILKFSITANAFLYHMVRNIIGALIYVGNGKLSVNQFKELIDNKARIYAPPTFMPDGLYLAFAKYPIDYFNYKAKPIFDYE